MTSLRQESQKRYILKVANLQILVKEKCYIEFKIASLQTFIKKKRHIKFSSRIESRKIINRNFFIVFIILYF